MAADDLAPLLGVMEEMHQRDSGAYKNVKAELDAALAELDALHKRAGLLPPGDRADPAAILAEAQWQGASERLIPLQMEKIREITRRHDAALQTARTTHAKLLGLRRLEAEAAKAAKADAAKKEEASHDAIRLLRHRS